MSFAADTILELCARLRLMARSLGIDPWDVRLQDVSDAVRGELMAEAERDFWRLMHAAPTTTTTSTDEESQARTHPLGRPRRDDDDAGRRAMADR